jgi:hypothetical protein
MKRLTLLTLLLVTAACSAPTVKLDQPRPTLARFAGSYHGPAGHVGSLDLDASGTYECFVVNGMSAAGCADFVGAGLSRGLWVLDGSSIALTPTMESKDLVISLAGSTAVLSDEGLVLTIDGLEHFLVRAFTEAKPAAETTQAPGG